MLQRSLESEAVTTIDFMQGQCAIVCETREDSFESNGREKRLTDNFAKVIYKGRLGGYANRA